MAWGWIILSVFISVKNAPEFFRRVRSINVLTESIEGDKATNKGMLIIGIILKIFWVIFPLQWRFGSLPIYDWWSRC